MGVLSVGHCSNLFGLVYREIAVVALGAQWFVWGEPYVFIYGPISPYLR